jgi:hypothetical protein
VKDLVFCRIERSDKEEHKQIYIYIYIGITEICGIECGGGM